MRNLMRAFASLVGLVCLATPSAAKVIKFEVVKIESPAFEGRVFGSVGTYDRITARATIAVSSSDPRNSIIVDLDRAPRNAKGLVEAATDVEIVRPTVAANGNRRLLYDVVNRGNKVALSYFNDFRTNNLVKASDAGSGFLMNRGYTIVFSGWQGDVPAGGGRVTISIPAAPGITGVSREEFVFDDMKNPAIATLTYPAADQQPTPPTLTVRQRETDPRVTPADLTFKFDEPNKVSIARPAGFDAGAIYELIYLAKDPKPMGLGFAASRDIVSFLRRERADETGAPNPIAGQIEHAIAFGQSQSGRFLRDFLYQGFNEDETGRQVFEGLIPHIAGGKKMFTNYPFGQPGRNMQQHGDKLFPGAQFPFSYPVTSDAISGRSDGILARCLAAGNCPKIMHVDTQLEFYQSLASLVTTDTGGKALAMPDNVRLYLLSSLQHAAAANAKSEVLGSCTYPINPLYAGAPLRALLVAMEAWIAGTAPPESRYPSVADGTLITPAAQLAAFPKMPTYEYKATLHEPTLVDHAVIPPAKKTPYPIFVAKTDQDGNDIAGVRLPTLAAPIATHLGYNLRKAGFSEGALCGNFGSMLPFAKTAEERLKTNDPRLSLAERYPREGDRAVVIEKAAMQLVKDRLLLEDDAKAFMQAID